LGLGGKSKNEFTFVWSVLKKSITVLWGMKLNPLSRASGGIHEAIICVKMIEEDTTCCVAVHRLSAAFKGHRS
jgi:hypothetical protein